MDIIDSFNSSQAFSLFMRDCARVIFLKMNQIIEGEPLDIDDVNLITKAFKIHFADLNGNIANQKENILDCAVCSDFDSDSCDCINSQKIS